MGKMKITVLGSGTSHGIPVIACECEVCKSTDSRDKRTRCSALVCDDDTSILIDCGPEFRIQSLRENVKKVDAVLLTHSHADHLHGIDDLRVFSCKTSLSISRYNTPEPMKIYTNSKTISDFSARFDYLFKPVLQGGGRAFVELEDNSVFSEANPIKIGKFEIIPIPMMHGKLETSGYLISKTQGGVKKSFAYLTDTSFIPESSFDLIARNCGIMDTLIIDGLRIKPHSTHFSFEQALDAAEKIGANHTWLTHLCHDTSHLAASQYINWKVYERPSLLRIVKNGGSVLPAYDGLKIEI